MWYVLQQVKKENPEISFGEVGKVLGEKWKAIGATEKAKFEEMAKKDKVCTCIAAPLRARTHQSAMGGIPIIAAS